MFPAGATIIKLTMMGPGGVGKSNFCLRFVSSCFSDMYDPTIEETYRKQINVDGHPIILEILDTAGEEEFSSMWRGWMSYADVAVFICSMRSPFSDYAEHNCAETVRLLRERHSLPPDAPVPAFFVVAMCDLPASQVQREFLIAKAKQHGFLGYYETSAKNNVNIDQVISDLVRMHRQRISYGLGWSQAATAQTKPSLFSSLLPWRKSKKSDGPSIVSAKAEAEINAFVLPSPNVSVPPVPSSESLLLLITEPEGLRMTDVAIVGDDGGEPLPVHKVVVCCQSETLCKLLRCDDKVVTIPGITTAVLKTIIHYLYASDNQNSDQLFDTEIQRCLGILRIPYGSNAFARLGNTLTDPTFKSLCDVTFKVQNAEFKAHRAILWARSTWFRSLIGERWHANAPSVDVRDIDPEVFSTLLDFMYTDSTDVLIAAGMLVMPRLLAICETHLCESVSQDNCVALLQLAETHQAQQLCSFCIHFIAMHFAEISSARCNQISEECKQKIKELKEQLEKEREALRKRMVVNALMKVVLMPVQANATP